MTVSARYSAKIMSRSGICAVCIMIRRSNTVHVKGNTSSPGARYRARYRHESVVYLVYIQTSTIRIAHVALASNERVRNCFAHTVW